MLSGKDSSAIVAVRALGPARDFYEQKLGLELVEESGSVLRFKTGATSLVIYQSDFAGTNQANAVVWGVGEDIETIVATLGNKGVVFEHYEGMDRRGDIHVAGDFRMAWFKDPDGNILHLNSM